MDKEVLSIPQIARATKKAKNTSSESLIRIGVNKSRSTYPRTFRQEVYTIAYFDLGQGKMPAVKN